MGASGGIALYSAEELESILPEIQALFKEHSPEWECSTLAYMAYASAPYTAIWEAKDYPFLKKDLFRLTYGTNVVGGFEDALFDFLNQKGVRRLLLEETWT